MKLKVTLTDGLTKDDYSDEYDAYGEGFAPCDGFGKDDPCRHRDEQIVDTLDDADLLCQHAHVDGQQIDYEAEHHEHIASDDPYIDILAPPGGVRQTRTMFEHHLRYDAHQGTNDN